MLTISILESTEREEEKKKHTQTQKTSLSPFILLDTNSSQTV